MTGGPQDRAAGALYGLAIGDALGMPTESLPRSKILAVYGSLVDGFHPAPDGHPLAAGLPAGTVTDDTEQAVLLAGQIIAGRGRVDGAALARELLAWEESMRARGSASLLGPSTHRALAALRAGASPEEAGRHGTTNGAAMRIAPAGLAVPPERLDRLVGLVTEASRVTHSTSVALAGAAAVAAAVSAGVGGAGIAEATQAAVAAARVAARRGYWVAAADVAARITWAAGLVAGQPADRALTLIYELVGTGLATQESVPAAFAVVAACPDDPWRACCLAASLGGDTDTIAAMAGAIAGACHGAGAFPAAARQTVTEVNGLELDNLAAALLELRAAG